MKSSQATPAPGSSFICEEPRVPANLDSPTVAAAGILASEECIDYCFWLFCISIFKKMKFFLVWEEHPVGWGIWYIKKEGGGS